MHHQIAHKACNLQTASLLLIEAALTHVVNGLLVHLAHRSAVRTLHVVGVDLQLGHRLDAGLLREKEVAVLLLGIGALGIFCHIDHTLEASHRLTTCHTTRNRATAAIGRKVVRADQKFGMLTIGGQEDAIDFALGLCTTQIDRIGDVGRTQLHRGQLQVAGGLLLHLHRCPYGSWIPDGFQQLLC